MTNIDTYRSSYIASGAVQSDSFISALIVKRCDDTATAGSDAPYVGRLRWTSTNNEFDLSEIVVQDVQFERGTLRRREPLILRPMSSESGELYQFDVKELEISITAYTREELVDLLHDFIVVLWNEYALEDDANLTANARELKNLMLNDFYVV